MDQLLQWRSSTGGWTNLGEKFRRIVDSGIKLSSSLLCFSSNLVTLNGSGWLVTWAFEQASFTDCGDQCNCWIWRSQPIAWWTWRRCGDSESSRTRLRETSAVADGITRKKLRKRSEMNMGSVETPMEKLRSAMETTMGWTTRISTSSYIRSTYSFSPSLHESIRLDV